MRVGGWVARSTYRDSVRLMRIATYLRRVPGVRHVELLMGTASNLEALRQAGLMPPEVLEVRPRAADLVIVAAGDPDAVEEVLRQAQAIIEGSTAVGPGGAGMPSGVEAGPEVATTRSLDGALSLLPDANLAFIAVPGPYVRREALRALARGLHLMIFSDNVPIEDEVAIKREARQRGLLVMGPDCGTALLRGAALGFCNRVRRGPVGLVGAAGTGLQEVMSLIHRAGSGISHAIGVGTHDVMDAVGGQSTLAALDLLGADPATRVIVLVGKPPDHKTASRLMAHVGRLPRPSVVCLLGLPDVARGGQGVSVATLEEAAIHAVALAEGWPVETARAAVGAENVPDQETVLDAAARLAPSQRFVRGLFAGGTLATEAALVLSAVLGNRCWGNLVLAEVRPLSDPRRSREHTVIDLGDDIFTRGRPHPLLEPVLRGERLLAEAADPSVAVILLDIVLGHGVHSDPAGATIPAIQRARELARSQGRELCVVASVCGTDRDPQGWSRQLGALRAAGVLVAASNAGAARLAGEIARMAGKRR